MRLILLLLFMLAMLISAGCGDHQMDLDKLPVYSKVYSPNHDPEADLDFALKDAVDSDRRVLMMVGGDWCPWCRALDKFFIEDHPELNRLLHENFVLLKVYYGKDNYNRNFLSGFPLMTGTPHFYVLDADGSLVHSQQTEVLEKGRSYDPLKMQAFLEKWVPAQSQ